MPSQFLERFDNMGEDETSQSRLRYWARGWEMFKDNPIIGIGYNNWVPYYQSRYPGESLREGRQEVAHSAPVTVLAELGAFGFIIYYFIVIKILLINRRIQKESTPTTDKFIPNIARALNIGLIGYLVTSGVVSVAYYPFLWIQACLTVALDNIRKKDIRQ